MARCSVCGKSPQSGNNVSHSHRKTRRSWDLNTKRTTVSVNGSLRKATVCTRCLRTMAKASAA